MGSMPPNTKGALFYSSNELFSYKIGFRKINKFLVIC